MTSPRTSVIMPVYNTADSVVQAIESVLQQTDSDFELIIMNDQSPDNADQVISDYLQKISDTRVRYLTNPQNLGLAGTRNAAMKIARGEWLSFIDSDDAYDLNFLEIMHQAVAEEARDIDVVVCAIDTVYEDGTRTTRPRKEAGVYEGKDAMLRLMRDEMTPYACDKIFRKAQFSNLEFPLINRVEDAGFSIAAYSQARYVKVIDPSLYLYTVNPTSITWGSVPPLSEMARFMDYLKMTTNAHRGGDEEQNAMAVSWLITYLNGAQSALRLEPDNLDDYLKACREALRVPIILRALKVRPYYGAAATLLKVSPLLYKKLYGAYVKRTYGL